MSEKSRRKDRERTLHDLSRPGVPGKMRVATGAESYVLKKLGITQIKSEEMVKIMGEGIKSAAEAAAERLAATPEASAEEIKTIEEKIKAMQMPVPKEPAPLVLPEFGCHNCDHFAPLPGMQLPTDPEMLKRAPQFCIDTSPKVVWELIDRHVPDGRGGTVTVQAGQKAGAWPLMNPQDECHGWAPKGYTAKKRRSMVEEMAKFEPLSSGRTEPGACAMGRTVEHLGTGEPYHTDVAPPTKCEGEKCEVSAPPQIA